MLQLFGAPGRAHHAACGRTRGTSPEHARILAPRASETSPLMPGTSGNLLAALDTLSKSAGLCVGGCSPEGGAQEQFASPFANVVGNANKPRFPHVGGQGSMNVTKGPTRLNAHRVDKPVYASSWRLMAGRGVGSACKQ